MATTAIFGKRIAQKIFLSFVLPLVVLLVAGLLVPVFLWFSLDRFREEYDQRTRLVQLTETLKRSAQDRDGAIRNVRRYGGEFRKQLTDATVEYQAAIYATIDWLEKRPDSELEQAFEHSQRTFGDWRNQILPQKPIPPFEPVLKTLEALEKLAVSRRDEYLPIYQRAEVFRRIAAVIVPAIAMLAALMIGRAIALGIARPLETLTQASEQLKGGAPWISGMSDLSFEDIPNDEIGDLQRAFLEMARAIGQREAVLRAQNEALVAIRRRVEAVLNATNDGIAMLDRAGGFSVINRRFAYFFGVEPEEMQDHTFEQARPLLLARFRNKEVVRERLQEVLRDAESIADETYEILHPTVRTIRLFSAPVRGEAPPEGGPGELLGRIVVIRDVTRETEVDRMKTEFVSTVSHELRTPLTAIKGYVDLIVGGKTGPLSELQQEFLTMVQTSTERLTALINEILDISRIESGRVEMRRESVDYGPLVRQTVRMLMGEAEAKRIALAAELPDDAELPAVVGDSERITQVLVNLISNAIKYTPEEGVVTVSVRGEGNFVATCVSDTGIGITTEDRERIFQKFYRADNSTTRETGGTGLGLAITKAVIERLGGSIWVESGGDRGSRFWFTLPVASESDLPQDAVSVSPKRRKLYLIVDGDTGALHRIAHALRPQNIIASTAAHPAEALRRARGLRPDAILLDPLTPAFDAWGLLRALRADPAASRLPIVYYSLQQGRGFLEARDLLRIVRPPEPGETGDAFAAAVHSAMASGSSAHTGAIVVLGGSDILAAVRAALSGRETGAIIGAPTPAEADHRLGSLLPALMVIDARHGDGGAAGRFVREARERHADARVPVLLIADTSLIGSNAAPLVRPGGGALPVERFARAAQMALGAAILATSDRRG